ncbi:MAG TPA: hypothetical protein VMV34_08110 [Terriglobia bacterium]|nr:hypothetical protein [Terriglobia bacterium]
MQRLATVILIMGLSVSPLLAAQGYSTQMQILKGRQKQALKALKLKQKYAKETLTNHGVPMAVRRQLKHQLKSEERKLREQQKDERQELKDQQRLSKQVWK